MSFEWLSGCFQWTNLNDVGRLCGFSLLLVTIGLLKIIEDVHAYGPTATFQTIKTDAELNSHSSFTMKVLRPVQAHSPTHSCLQDGEFF